MPEITETSGGNSKGEARLWQPYADYLVYSVLVALPWGGSELMEASIADSSSFLEAAEKYMDARPIKLTTSLRPFFEGQDTASTSDSGAASFLGQVSSSKTPLNTQTASIKVLLKQGAEMI